MTNERIAVPYNHKLKRFETLLAGVQRAGDFFVQGSLDAPIPRVEIDGVGMLSFPVPAPQIEAVIKRAHRAPYGRGERTIVDTSVRNAWQLDAADVRISGKAWEKTLNQIMSTVVAGLGCSGMKVSAKLYKLLVYETGGLFRPHRDTEKADGMFGTLVVVLPSAHGGGELIIRHGTREVSVNLSSPEVSELIFAAFYADCEHEVKPITHGNRVCLTYNLSLAKREKNKNPRRQAVVTAPVYEREVGAVAEILKVTFRKAGAPTKLAWLLEHQYSAAGLSFAGLKSHDAARVQVLRQAAERAGCVAHLGIVHIEETGPAEPHFEMYGYDGWQSGWQAEPDGEEDLDEEREAAVRDDFEVIEVSDAWHYVDHWVDTQNRSLDFGKLPLKENELLPAGALDDAAPDEQRLTEATGNEGASFERSYRRAALVMWPRHRSADVLLEGGVRAVMPYLKDIAQRCRLPSASRAERATARSTAGRIVARWKRELADLSGLVHEEEPSRGDMVTVLGQVAEPALLEAFVNEIVMQTYDGSENEALATNAALLGARKVGELFSTLARAHVPARRGACVDLLSRLVREQDQAPDPAWMSGLRNIAAAIIEALPKRQNRPAASDLDDGLERPHDTRRATESDAEMMVTLLDSLAAIDAPDLRRAACDAIAAAKSCDSARVVSALSLLCARDRKTLSADNDYRHLWHHAATMLLARSEHPPEAPKDWRQQGTIRCTCGDCRELQTFMLDPVERTHRFRLRKDRRRHLHEQIQRDGLDMTHETERRGSPHTLVCTKTRRTYVRQRAEHKADVTAMATLLRIIDGATGELAILVARMVGVTGSELE